MSVQTDTTMSVNTSNQQPHPGSDLIISQVYSGCYGGETSNVGDIIVANIQCPIYPPSLTRKQVIFVVDESGSMCSTIVAVQASLFAARNSLIRLMGINLSTMDESNRDTVFSETCNASIITFSDLATCRWESNNALKAKGANLGSMKFSEAVNNIKSDASTNMGDALKLAFSKKIPECATWIILFTDGVSNKGPCQTVSGFKSLMKDLPAHTKIIPLGYTTSFDPDVLSVLGNMTYVENEESIAEILGSITAEIVTCYGINGKITLPRLESGNVNPDDVIIVPDTINDPPRDIIGSSDIGCLFNERKFMYGHLPWGNVHKADLSRYIGLKGTISYYDIAGKSTVNIPFSITNGGDTVPDDVFDNYFASSKGRILLGIYQAKRSGRFNKEYIETVTTKINDWKHPSAQPHKEEIMRLLNNTNMGRSDELATITTAVSTHTQTNYTNVARYTTTTQRTASTTASEDAQLYSSAQPFIPPNIHIPRVTIDSTIHALTRHSLNGPSPFDRNSN